jgi:SAM-dependent methyltransferase
MSPERDDTAAYFEAHPDDYSPRRLETALAWLTELAAPGDSLLDAGCGTGLFLEAAVRAGIDRPAGCDVSSSALRRAAQRVEFEAHTGSILDAALVMRLEGRFRFVTLTAVLHHLVARTRRSSQRLAETAVAHSLRLLQPGGRLIVVEPTFAPAWAMTALFWTKRGVTAVTDGRVELGRWNNIGAPLVSFYGPTELDRIISDGGGRVQRGDDRTWSLRRLPRILGIRNHWTSTRLVAP